MKIVTVVFDYPEHSHDFNILHNVFKESCRVNMPDVEFVTIHPENIKHVIRHPVIHTTNTIKLREWNKYIQAVDDDVILADSDMLCHAPGYHAFDEKFDIAYTMREEIRRNHHEPRRTINGGIVMVSNTAAAKSWINQMCEINERMYTDHMFHAEWLPKNPGLNQTAMMWMLKASNHPAIIHKYLTKEWNLVDCDWHYVKQDSVFIHCKGALRTAIIKGCGNLELKPIVDEWIEYYNKIYGEEKKYIIKPNFGATMRRSRYGRVG